MRFLIEQDTAINRDRAQARARKDLENLSNYEQYLKKAQFEYLKKLSEIRNEDLRARYLDYLSKLKISFAPETVNLINRLYNQKRLDIYDKSSFINDAQFFINEDDVEQRNKIKVYIYFSDEDNAKYWGFKSSKEALKNLKYRNGNWKSYQDIASWLEQVDYSNKSKQASSNKSKSTNRIQFDDIDPDLIDQALDVIESMGIKQKEADKLLIKLAPMLNKDLSDADVARMILQVR